MRRYKYSCVFKATFEWKREKKKEKNIAAFVFVLMQKNYAVAIDILCKPFWITFNFYPAASRSIILPGVTS